MKTDTITMWFISLLPILLLHGALANDTSNVHNDGEISVATFTTLLDRIDQLEKKLVAELEERDRQHSNTISALQADHQRDLANVRRQLDKQMTRISRLESTTRRQQQKIKVLLKSRAVMNENLQKSRIASNSNGHDATQEIRTNRDVSQMSPAANANVRSRRADNEVEVAFFFTLSSPLVHLGANQNVVFDTEITNIGNAYNGNIGSFIAPVAGTYVFSMTIMTDVRHVSHYGLFHNSTLLVRVYVNGAENAYDSDTQTAVIRMKQGDDVEVRHIDTDHSVHGDRFCSFSGFLLSQDFTSTASPIVGK